MLSPIAGTHAVNGNPTLEPFPEGMETIVFGETPQTETNPNVESSGIFGVTLAPIGMEALANAMCAYLRLHVGFPLGMGCFWGAERLFWRLPEVFSTQVGYAGGFTPNPNYHEVCSGNNTLCICISCTHGRVLTDPAPFPPRGGGGKVIRQDVSPSDQSGFKMLKNAKGKWRVGRGKKALF